MSWQNFTDICQDICLIFLAATNIRTLRELYRQRNEVEALRDRIAHPDTPSMIPPPYRGMWPR